VFLSVLPLLVMGCGKGESNLTQSTPKFDRIGGPYSGS